MVWLPWNTFKIADLELGHAHPIPIAREHAGDRVVVLIVVGADVGHVLEQTAVLGLAQQDREHDVIAVEMPAVGVAFAGELGGQGKVGALAAVERLVAHQLAQELAQGLPAEDPAQG